MKIVQNPESGEIGIQLEQNEKYNIGEHLSALIEFVCKQAIETYQLTNSYKKLSERLDALEKLSKVETESKVD